MKIHSLFYYPVKSMAAVPTAELSLNEYGPKWDREWMVIDENSNFLTQRELPRLALFHAYLSDQTLHIKSPSNDTLLVDLSASKDLTTVTVWGDSVQAWDEGDTAADWLQSHLGRLVRLVRIGPGAREKESNGVVRRVRFPDSYPLLLCSIESMAELNARLPEPLSLLRFRPNIVIEGCAPFSEDFWESLTIDGHTLSVAKACTRCSIITVDPTNAEKGQEPLKTLAGYRKRGNKVEFGQYLMTSPGLTLRLGQTILTKNKS